MNQTKHYIAAISSFVIWGVFAIPLKAIQEYGADTILYFRILFSAIFLLLALVATRKSAIRKDWKHLRSLSGRQRRQSIVLTLLGGLLLTVNWLVYIYIINQVNVKTASFAYLICPVLTAVFGYVLLKEHLSRLQWLAVFFCIVSCTLIGIGSARELMYGFTAAITYALYLNSQRKNQGFDTMVILTIQVLFALTILTLSGQFFTKSLPDTLFFYEIIGLIAVGFTVLPLFLNLYALSSINSSTVGVLLYVNPLINFALAVGLFHERVSGTQLAGYLIILLALFLFNLELLLKLRTRLSKARVPLGNQ